MKHFLTLAALIASMAALAQNPNYDPDSNGDDLIGAEDLQSFLAVYNTMLTAEQVTIGYIDDFDFVVANNGDQYYTVPDSIDIALFPDTDPIGSLNFARLILDPTERKMLTFQVDGNSFAGSPINYSDPFHVYAKAVKGYGLKLQTIVYFDGRWFEL